MNKRVTFDDYVAAKYGVRAIPPIAVKVVVSLLKQKRSLLETSDKFKLSEDMIEIIYPRTLEAIKNRIDKLCREPKVLIQEEKIILPLVLGIGAICPKCGSHQFSISVPNMRPAGWPNVLGLADCRGCQQDFFVKLAPELENVVFLLLRSNKIDHVTTMNVLKAMFPNS